MTRATWILVAALAVAMLSLAAAPGAQTASATPAVPDERPSVARRIVGFFHDRGSELGQWLGQHIYLTVIAMSVAIAVAVPLGLVLTRARRVSDKVIAGVGVIQTVPSLALVGLTVPWLGGGAKAALVALFLYALLPIVRNTYTGVLGVDPAMIEAARGMGMTSRQILVRIELPLSVPIIMAGIRTSTVICVGIATLGGIIGAGGLGEPIWEGIDRVDDALIYVGAIPAIGLALALDGLLALGQRAFTPAGLQASTQADVTAR